MSNGYDNSGTLFKNDRKEKPNQADYNGSITVDGMEYWLNAWLKDGKKGKFFSLSVKPKDAGSVKQKPASKIQPDDSDSVPF